MSGVISFSTSLKYTDTDRKISKTMLSIPNGRITRDSGLQLMIEGIQTIGFAAHEAIVIGEVTSPGMASFLNVSAENFVQIGFLVSGSFHQAIKLYPGDASMLWLEPSKVWYAQANTAAVDLAYSIFQRNA
jgi:hypothetical protein